MTPLDNSTGQRQDASAMSGLQAERTSLAWSRTALAVAANAALLSLNEFKNVKTGVVWLPIALALTIVLATALIGERRKRTLQHRPLPARLALTVTLPVVGYAITALSLMSGAILIF